MTSTKDELAQLLQDGVVSDIAKAERAYALLAVVGQHAEAINASKRNYGELFGTVQHLAAAETLISVARLYDRPSRKYPTRCLRALLEQLENQADALPPIVDKFNLWRDLARQGMSRAAIDELKRSSDRDITRALVAFLRSRLDNPETAQAVDRIKLVRDKAIAHNEDIKAYGASGPTWTSVLALLSVAKDVVGVVGWAYLSIVYMHEGEYQLTSDAKRPSRAMQRLLEDLGIVASSRRRSPRTDAPES